MKKIISKLLLSLLLLTQLTSCDYLAGFIGHGILGAIAYPFARLAEAFADGVDDFYERDLTDAQRRQLEEALRLVNYCKNVEGVEIPPQLGSLAAALSQRSCLGCVPFGQIFECREYPDNRSDEELRTLFGSHANDIMSTYTHLQGNCCSATCENRCERMCPESAEILGQARSSSVPFRENTIPIGNSAATYGNPTAFNGACHGHATVRHNIATLAQWDPSGVPTDESGQPITSADALDSYYAEILRDLARGEVRRVPGYSNVRDFTLRPGLNTALHDAVMDSFHVQAALNPFMLESAATENDLSESRFNEAMQDIDRSIAVSGTAQTTFGVGGLTGHTVEVYHRFNLTSSDGRPMTRLCIIDSNRDVCTSGTGTPTVACTPDSSTGSGGSDYLTRSDNVPESLQSTDGTYCPRSVDVYRDNWSYRFPGHGVVSGSSFQVDRQQDRNVRDNISALSSFCKRDRGC
jgi:hypothetical protein